MIKNYKDKYAKFIISGGVSTIIDFVIYTLLTSIISITPSKAISITCASSLAFILNKNWVFSNSNSNKKTTLFRYCIVFFINLLVNVTTNGLIYEFTGKKIFSFFIATILASIVNFSLQNKWVFK